MKKLLIVALFIGAAQSEAADEKRIEKECNTLIRDAYEGKPGAAKKFLNNKNCSCVKSGCPSGQSCMGGSGSVEFSMPRCAPTPKMKPGQCKTNSDCSEQKVCHYNNMPGAQSSFYGVCAVNDLPVYDQGPQNGPGGPPSGPAPTQTLTPPPSISGSGGFGVNVGGSAPSSGNLGSNNGGIQSTESKKFDTCLKDNCKDAHGDAHDIIRKNPCKKQHKSECLCTATNGTWNSGGSVGKASEAIEAANCTCKEGKRWDSNNGCIENSGSWGSGSH